MLRMSRTRSAVEGVSDLITDSVQPVSLAKCSQTTLGLPAAAFSRARASLGANASGRPNIATVPPAIFMKSRRVRPSPLLVSIASTSFLRANDVGKFRSMVKNDSILVKNHLQSAGYLQQLPVLYKLKSIPGYSKNILQFFK